MFFGDGSKISRTDSTLIFRYWCKILHEFFVEHFELRKNYFLSVVRRRNTNSVPRQSNSFCTGDSSMLARLIIVSMLGLKEPYRFARSHFDVFLVLGEEFDLLFAVILGQ